MVWRAFKKRFGNLTTGQVVQDIDPDEILIDAENLPRFDTDQFEGRLERPISKGMFFAVGFVCLIIAFSFILQLSNLEVFNGKVYAERSEKNRLRHTLIFAERGVIVDRNNELLAWNVPSKDNEFPLRAYIKDSGFGHLLGYVSYPAKDSSGFYYNEQFSGKDGVESTYDKILRGKNGLKITEADALNNVVSESLLEPPQNGERLTLSIDMRLQRALYGFIAELAGRVSFPGGAGVILDVKTGEVLGLVSFPEYSSQILSDGKDEKAIEEFRSDRRKPFLNRAVAGLYTPGSIVKPFLATGALEERIISPEKQILSTGSISIPNPYLKEKETVFKDWKAHGLVDMRRAIAVSSNVYFYEIGGGFENQAGLGISRIEKYMRLFGFGSTTGIDIGVNNEKEGIIPNPEWKEQNFPGEPWRIGDTYHTAIGQYGLQITAIQAVRAIAAIANGGILLTPTVLMQNQSDDSFGTRLPINDDYLKIVREGMRQGVLEGTASALNTSAVDVAGKTGTAELGTLKQSVNSWVIGFFPYEHPRIAFAVTMESGRRGNLLGAPYVMRELLDWMAVHTKEYFTENVPEGPIH